MKITKQSLTENGYKYSKVFKWHNDETFGLINHNGQWYLSICDPNGDNCVLMFEVETFDDIKNVHKGSRKAVLKFLSYQAQSLDMGY
jgi:hypothetical protein